MSIVCFIPQGLNFASLQKDDPATLNEKIRVFEEKEKQRVRNALEEHDTKYARKLRELKEKNATAIRELEEIHVSFSFFR